MSGVTVLRLVAYMIGTATVCTTSFSEASSADFKGREAVLWNPGGKFSSALEKAYIASFEAETGAKIRLVEANIDQAISAASAQSKAGSAGWDGLAAVDSSYMPRLIAEGVVQTMDASDIPSLKSLPKTSLNDYGIPMMGSVATVSYRDADGVVPLRAVSDFFDPTIKGARAMSSLAGEAQYICTLALLSDGVTIDELSKRIDVDRCLKIVDRIKDQVTDYWANGSQMAQLMIDDSVDYCLSRDGRILQAALANPEWEDSVQWRHPVFGYFVRLKGAKNGDIIEALAKYSLDPKRQAEFTEELGYSAPNPESLAFLPDTLKPFISAAPQAQAVLTTIPAALFERMADQQVEIG
ncbi:putative spermidine/putrescine transport system substrate-binding protein, partial [Sinorhizobium terangae]